jgi:hypothetical protein
MLMTFHSAHVSPKKKHRRFYVAILLAVLVFSPLAYYFFYVGTGQVDLEVITEKSVYTQGEDITFQVYAINQYYWRVSHSGSASWGIEDIIMTGQFGDFASGWLPSYPMLSKTPVQTFTWNQKLSNNSLALPGNYTFFYSMTNGPTGKCTIEIKANP